MALKEYLFHNFWAKLLSVLFATLLWLVLSFGQGEGLNGNGVWLRSSHEKVFANLPVHVLRRSPDGSNRRFVLDPTTVTITIKGSAMVLNDIQVGDIKPFVNLAERARTKTSESKQSASTTNQVYVYLPPTVSSVSMKVEPPSVTVRRPDTD